MFVKEFTTHISNKELLYKMCKELQTNKKKSKQPNLEMGKRIQKALYKGIRMANKHMKRQMSHHYSSGKLKLKLH